MAGFCGEVLREVRERDFGGGLVGDFEVDRGGDLAGLEWGYAVREEAYFLLMREGEVFAGEVTLPFATGLLTFFGAILGG